jgi:hypothetical protein
MNDQENPYLASAVTSRSAITPDDLKALEFYWLHREHSPSLAYMLSRYFLQWTRLFLVIAVFCGLMYVALAPDFMFYLVVLLLGLLVGVVARDVAYARSVVHRWPLFRRVVDWDKVGDLLGRPRD